MCNKNTVPGILIKITIASKLCKQLSQIFNHGKQLSYAANIMITRQSPWIVCISGMESY